MQIRFGTLRTLIQKYLQENKISEDVLVLNKQCPERIWISTNWNSGYSGLLLSKSAVDSFDISFDKESGLWIGRHEVNNKTEAVAKSKSLHQLTKLLMNQSRDFDI